MKQQRCSCKLAIEETLETCNALLVDRSEGRLAYPATLQTSLSKSKAPEALVIYC